MRKQENGGACSRCNYDGRETEAGGQQEPTPPGNTRRIGSGSLARGLFDAAQGVMPHPKRDCPIQVLGGALDYARCRKPRLGVPLRRHLRDHHPCPSNIPERGLRFACALGRQSQPDRTHSAPTYWLRERLRGPPSVSLPPHIGGIKRMPTKNGPRDRPRRAIPWSQVRFAHDSPLREKDSNPRSRARERFSRLPRLSSPSRWVARGTAASNLYSSTAEYG